MQDIIESVQSVPRLELVAFEGNRVVGFCSLVVDYDAHVGQCLSVHWCNVLGAHRGAGVALYRRAYAVARQLGISVICRTRRVQAGVYTMKFIKLE